MTAINNNQYENQNNVDNFVISLLENNTRYDLKIINALFLSLVFVLLQRKGRPYFKKLIMLDHRVIPILISFHRDRE